LDIFVLGFDIRHVTRKKKKMLFLLIHRKFSVIEELGHVSEVAMCSSIALIMEDCIYIYDLPLYMTFYQALHI